MTPADIDRVFGRGRLRMVTGEHVEVFREASLPGERRRYTKRFLATQAGDFRHWTEREWRILARLVGHGIGPVPDVVQFDRGAADRPALVQTYDAGITVDHWATLLPVHRDGILLRHVFEDCAHWWALARHCLVALDAIHELQLVHLDLKADNVCIPFGPTDFNPRAPDQCLSPRFEQIALIDFAFSLVSGESLTRALPIARQHDYEYQSPRLLQALEAGSRGDLLPTRQLDWRCDVFSLAAMLRRYLPDPEVPLEGSWTRLRYAQARALVRRLLEAHDAERPVQRPHAELLALTALALDDEELTASLSRGWSLAIDDEAVDERWPTPVTRIAMPISVDLQAGSPAIARLDRARQSRVRTRRLAAVGVLVSVAAIGAPWLYDAWWMPRERAAGGSPLSNSPPPATSTAVLARAPTLPPEAAPARSIETATAAVAATAAEPQAASSAASATVAAPATDAVAETAPDKTAPPASPSALAAAFAPPVALAPAPVPTRPTLRTALPVAAPSVMAARVKTPTRIAATPARVPPVAGKTRSPSALSAQAGRVVRPVARVSSPLSDRDRALAWLTQRGPAPQSKAHIGLDAWAAVALAPAPQIAAVPARAVAPGPTPVLASTPTPARASIPVPPPQVLPSPPVAQSDEVPAPVPKDFAARAGELLTTDLPRIALSAERRVRRVLNLAAQPETAWQDDAIRRAAIALRDNAEAPLATAELAAEDARLLHGAAQVAFWRRGSAREAHGLQLKAFGANPLDADVVSGLAFLSLKQGPPQAELARQLSLYALSLHDARNPGGRLEDWTTLAIASALSGREQDARNAWLVSLALAPQPERQCRAALNAYALHGERLRIPVEAMLQRAHASGRAEGSALCEWPPYWLASRSPR